MRAAISSCRSLVSKRRRIQWGMSRLVGVVVPFGSKDASNMDCRSGLAGKGAEAVAGLGKASLSWSTSGVVWT
jgi:hypothetical protein